MALLIWIPFVKNNYENQGALNVETSAIGTITYENGKLGSAVRIGDGTQVTNGISINKNLVSELGDEYSCAVWIKPVGTHVHYEGAIISSGNWNNKKWAFGVGQNNTTIDPFGPSYNIKVSCSIPVGEWTHLVSTVKDNIATIYKNGEYVGTYNYQNLVLESDATNTTIGRESYANGYFSFNGSIQDLRVYNHCLTEDDAAELAKGKVLHYTLDNNVCPNIVQQSNVFKVGSHANKITTSVLNDGTYQVVAESGNSNYTSSWWQTLTGIEDSFIEGETFTISFTIRSSDANKTNPPSIYIKSGMGYYNMIGSVTEEWSTVYYTGTWKKANTLVPHLGWASIAGTYQIKNWKIEKGSAPTSWIPYSYVGNPNMLTNTQTFVIPSGGGNGLTTETYSGFIIRHLSPRSGNSYRELAYYNSFVPVASGRKYTQSFWAKGTGKLRCYFYSGNISCKTSTSSQGVSSSSSDGDIEINLTSDWIRYWVTHELNYSSDTPTNKNILLRVMDGENDVYVRGWKLEIGDRATPWCPNTNDAEWATFYKKDPEYTTIGFDSNIEYDISGFINNGTKNNPELIIPVSDTKRYNTSTEFISKTKSISGFIKLQNFYMPDEFTLSFWWYYDTYKNAISNPPSSFSYGTPAGYITNGLHNYDGKFQCNIAPMNSDTKDASGSVAIAHTNKTWTHIAITFNGYILKSYINGTLNATYNYNLEAKHHVVRSSQDLIIGYDQAGGVYRAASGYLSDVRIYATCLSADDIAELYRKRN